MKNIFAIMKEYGIEIPEGKNKEFEKTVLENYKTVSEYENQKKKTEAAEGKLADTEKTLGTVQETLKTYDGVDVSALNKTIEDLKAVSQKKDEDYAKQIADRDFLDLLNVNIQAAKGVNAKAIMALLDLDTLKASKNQKDDIAAALKSLAEAEDSKMLFGAPEPQEVGIIDTIGTVRKPSNHTADAAMRAAMGLPPTTEGGNK
jgi:hypothetical protein